MFDIPDVPLHTPDLCPCGMHLDTEPCPEKYTIHDYLDDMIDEYPPDKDVE